MTRLYAGKKPFRFRAYPYGKLERSDNYRKGAVVVIVAKEVLTCREAEPGKKIAHKASS